MRTAHAKPCQRTMNRFPMGGVHSVQIRSELGRLPTRGGRPESESDTPVNIEDGLYCDNGEGVATPLPYPLVRRRIPGQFSPTIRLLTSAATGLAAFFRHALSP